MHYDIEMEIEKYFTPVECAGYLRLLQIYYRFVLLKLLGKDVSQKANEQIKKWKDWILEKSI
jgi:hypothetical protein